MLNSNSTLKFLRSAYRTSAYHTQQEIVPALKRSSKHKGGTTKNSTSTQRS